MQNKTMMASVLLCFIGFLSMAQGATPPPPNPPPPPGLPIDGGVVVLFLVAICYGVLKAYKLNRRENPTG